jgi:hypothetical protein
VLSNWQGGKAFLEMDGKEIPEGKDFRQGIEYEVDGSARLVLWIKKQSEKPVRFSIRSDHGNN